MTFSLKVLVSPKDHVYCGQCRFLTPFDPDGPNASCGLFGEELNTYANDRKARRCHNCLVAEVESESPT